MNHTMFEMFETAAKYITRRPALKASAAALALVAATALTTGCENHFRMQQPNYTGEAVQVYCYPDVPGYPKQNCTTGNQRQNPLLPGQQGIQQGIFPGGGYRGGMPGGAYPQQIVPPGYPQQPRQPHILGDTFQQQAPNVYRPDSVPPGFPPFGGGQGGPGYGGAYGGGATIYTPDPLQGMPRWQGGIDHSKQEEVLCFAPFVLAQDVRNPNKAVCQHIATGQLGPTFLKRMVSPAIPDPYAPSNQISPFQGGYTGHCPPFQTPAFVTGDGTHITSGYEEPKCWNPNTGRFGPPIPTNPIYPQQQPRLYP